MYMYRPGITESYYISILVALFGIALNIRIVVIFCRDRNIRSKIPNILLFHQATVDMVSYLLFIVPFSLWQIVPGTPKRIFWLQYSDLFMWTFSEFSSLFTFLLIGGERYAAICRPYWHKVHVNSKRVLLSILAVWLSSSVIVIIYILLNLKAPLSSLTFGFQICMIIVPVLLAVIITALFGLAFYNARISIRNAGNIGENKDSKRTMNTKETRQNSAAEYRLVLIFLLMYSVFVVAFACSVSITYSMHPVQLATGVFFLSLSSLFNPILTIVLKDDFKINWKKSDHTNRVSQTSNSSGTKQ